MNLNERRKAWSRNDETAEICANCRHFCKHYIRFPYPDGNTYQELSSGHCCNSQMKTRRNYDVCDRFERKETTATHA